ncbi:hypothetical protein BDV40DRAFT_299874 [Aspergillus tamarii]|uniref:Zn(2)-C6 fungal-type domain-containing protein n=1 Tax=Aspergillus tamarii TaxID=41984 RepID=A0A5N6UWF6_ASPTM|nr:hypothetical protein BDV40DRAFT_299874 [Aspergillus tamarii]
MPPHVGVIVNPSARRVACDQCHAQKLRCTKLNNCTVRIRCQRLSRQCIWSPPSRSGRPAKITAEETLIRRNTAREKRRKRSLSALEMTSKEDGRPDSAREHVHFSSVSTLAHTDHNNRPQPAPPAVGISEVPPPGPPSIADWNMSDIFNFSSPRGSSRENPVFPSLWTPDSRTPGLDSLQDITRELSNVNLSLFDLEQSLHAEPWGRMFASPDAVITKLSTCGDQPDDTLAHGYPLIDTFKKTQRFIDIVKQTSAYFASLPTQPASTLTSSFTDPPSSIGQAPSWHPSHALHTDSDINASSQGSSPFSPPVEVYTPRDMPPPYSASSSSTLRGNRPGRTASRDLPTALPFTTGCARILELYMTVLTQMSHFVHALSVQSMAGGA